MEEFLTKIDNFLTKFVKVCIAIFPGTFLVPPISLAIYILSFVYLKCIVRLAKWVGNPDLREPLDPGSAHIAAWESPFKEMPSLVIISVVVVTGVPDINMIRETVREKLFRKKDGMGKPVYPELLQTVEYFMGYPFWKRIPGLTEEQASEKYIRVVDRMGGWDPNSLLDFMKSFGLKPFQRNHRLWEMVILPDYVEDGSSRNEPNFAIVTRAPHVLTDGTGFLSLMRDAAGKTETRDLDISKFSIPSGYHVHKVLTTVYRGIYDLITFAGNDWAYASANSMWPKNSATCKARSKGFSAAHSLSMGNRCATLTMVRKVSKAWGVSSTSVILTAFLRSIRTSLLADEEVHPSSIVLLLPMGNPEHNGRLKNAMLIITPLLPLYVENPEIHARGVDKEFQRMKRSSLPFALDFMRKLIGRCPQLIAKVLAEKTGGRMSELVGTSTLVGPKEAPYLFGYKVKHVSLLLPLTNGERHPLFQLISVADKLYLSVTADKGFIEDDEVVGRMVEGFHEEISKFQDFYYAEVPNPDTQCQQDTQMEGETLV